MKSVVAAGILRHAATCIRSGIDVDAALRQASQGASEPVRELVLEGIQLAMPKTRKATPENIGQAILEAERRLQ